MEGLVVISSEVIISSGLALISVARAHGLIVVALALIPAALVFA